MAEKKHLSLHDACRAKGFEVAILATYNLNFPFFETVTLRALQSGGCRLIVVLADAGQVSVAFEHPERRPVRAGLEYILVPVTRAPTFHPKLLLQLGRHRTRLWLGSHNLTLAGFGRNLELTTRIELDRRRRPERALVQAAWAFMRAWIDDLPTSVLDMFDTARATARNNWIGSGVFPATVGTVSVLGSSDSGPSLFSQLREAVPTPIRRVSVLGPYFDNDLAFVDKLRDLAGQPEVVVAVYPEQAELPSSARAHERIRFVDLRQAALGPGKREGSRFMHAKALVFEHDDGTATLVTGSANPSRAAWLVSAPARNAEFVIVERTAGARVVDLGLDALPGLPALDDNAWAKLAARERERASSATPAVSRPTLLAWLEGGAVTVPLSFVADVTCAQLELLDEQDEVLGAAVSVVSSSTLARVEFDDAAISSATSLRNAVTQQRALLHHQEELRGRATGSRRQRFKAALLGLEADATQLNELFKLVSKVLDEPLITNETKTARSPVANAARGPSTPATITNFESSLYDGGIKLRALPRGRRALASSSDLAAIIEFLIFQLGLGRSAETKDEDADVVASEEELKDRVEDGVGLPEEDDHDEVPTPAQQRPARSKPLTRRERAKLCRRKVQTLLRRLQKHADKLGDDDDTLPIITHTIAVVGLLRHLFLLSSSSLAWRPQGESLLPSKRLREFFATMCVRLYGPQTRLVERALVAHGDRGVDEISSLHALMCWLAEFSGVDIADFERSDLLRADLEQRGISLGRAAGPLRACAEDGNALALALALSTKGAPRSEWLKRHLVWSRATAPDDAPRLGAFASVSSQPGRHVIVSLESNKVGLYILAKDRVVSFGRRFVTA